MYLVCLKYWTPNLVPLMVYPKVLFHPNFSIKVARQLTMAEGGALEGIRVLFGSHSHVAPPCSCSGASTAKTVTLWGAKRTILLPDSKTPPLAARSSSWWMAQIPCTQIVKFGGIWSTSSTGPSILCP